MRAIVPLLVLALLTVPAQALALEPGDDVGPRGWCTVEHHYVTDRPWSSSVSVWHDSGKGPFYLVLRSPSGHRALLGFFTTIPEEYAHHPLSGVLLFFTRPLEEMLPAEPIDHWILEIHARFACPYHEVHEYQALQTHLPVLYK